VPRPFPRARVLAPERQIMVHRPFTFEDEGIWRVKERSERIPTLDTYCCKHCFMSNLHFSNKSTTAMRKHLLNFHGISKTGECINFLL
jgi:hypothetical protein